MSEVGLDYAALAAATGTSAADARMAALLMPHATRRLAQALIGKTRFVHYTSAETATSIIKNKEIWLRKVACMNDLSEVRYGLERLYQVCSPDRLQPRLKNALNQIDSSIIDELQKLWSGWEPHLFSDSYVFCLSEHDSSEDTFGRLSMWRAYGRSCGVALVVNSQFSTAHPDLGAFTSPVAYFDESAFGAAFEELVQNLESNSEFFKSVQPGAVVGILFNVFRFAALGTKHPAFQEEREWRVIHSPKMDQSKHVIQTVEVVGGVPQPVCKIPLAKIDEVNLDAAIPSILDRVIIGPTDYPLAVWEAFVELLKSAGVAEPEKKVVLSMIPLRSS